MSLCPLFWKQLLCVSLAMTLPGFTAGGSEREGWTRHSIDDSSRGADGVRPFDINGDGHPDLVTGWEEGGRIRVYLHPGVDAAEEKWPSVTVGQVRSPEDAVFVDLDANGHVDVVSCCEGKTRSVYVHWAPTNADQLLDESAWRTEEVPALAGTQLFMFCLPMQVDEQNGIDLVIGSKGPGAQVGWLASPENPRHLEDWKWHPLYEAGWIMSLFAEDMDDDGDRDVLLTDRKGGNRGCKWLENPGDAETARGAAWKAHLIGGDDAEVMFAVPADMDGDGLTDVVSATRSSGLQVFRRLDRSGRQWERRVIEIPEGTGSGKAVHVDDIDQDGTVDVVLTCEHAENKHGVFWLSLESDGSSAFHPISGDSKGSGIKFDLIQLIDLDEDGDRDVLTCEERDQLGVIWYENPAR